MKKICVYCGSSIGKSPKYLEAAHNLALELVKRKISLIYGGVKVGIMGELANTVLSRGGEVIGIIPKLFVDDKIHHDGLSDLRIVDTMHERKALMASYADGFITLPGGLGTIEELFEILTWSQLGLHQKPCGLLNIEKYYDHISLFLNHATEEQFISDDYKKILLIEDTPNKLLSLMSTYQPPTSNRSIDTQ